MAQPLDIRVTIVPGSGLTVVMEGQPINTAGMENGVVLWGVVRYLIDRLPEDRFTQLLRPMAIDITENMAEMVEQAPEHISERPAADLFLQQQMVECAPPTDGSECCMCLEEAQPGESWSMLRGCQHKFHSHCIEEVTTNTCPMCRGDCSRNVRRRGF